MCVQDAPDQIGYHPVPSAEPGKLNCSGVAVGEGEPEIVDIAYWKVCLLVLLVLGVDVFFVSWCWCWCWHSVGVGVDYGSVVCYLFVLLWLFLDVGAVVVVVVVVVKRVQNMVMPLVRDTYAVGSVGGSRGGQSACHHHHRLDGTHVVAVFVVEKTIRT